MTTVPLDLVLDRRIEPCSSRFFVQVNAFWWSRLQLPVVTDNYNGRERKCRPLDHS